MKDEGMRGICVNAAETSDSEDKETAETAPRRQEAQPQGESLYPQKAMKAKKKEFLARRKLKKKSRQLPSKEDGSDGGLGADLEASILKDVHRPAFGEQAQQPLKVSSNSP